MIMGALGGPARTRGCPAQGRRGPLRAPGVLRRAHLMFLQGPPPVPVGFRVCQCQRYGPSGRADGPRADRQ